jgi:hypothetical protein
VPLVSPCFLRRYISFLKSFPEWDFIKNLSLSSGRFTLLIKR